MRTITALACLCFYCAAAEQAPTLKALYESHDWFRLREALQSAADAPPLYRAAVAAAFHDDAAAERALKEIVGSTKGSWEATEAARLLYWVSRRTAPDLNQPVGTPQPSRIRYSVRKGLLHIPLTINGQNVEYVFDTGAGCSVMLESEAKRLGLKFYQTEMQAFDAMTGGLITIRNIGIADRMKIGDSEYRGIFFLIFPDATHFLKDQPPGESGVLGLPDIQSLGSVRWDADGNFEIGFPSEPRPPEPNLAFDYERLIVKAEYEKRGLLFQLDTGAVQSGLYVGFRNEFPDLVNQFGKREKRTGGGAGGEIEYDAMVLPKIGLRAGGFDTVLQPADINLKQNLGYGYHGLFGLNLLNQAQVVTLDFRTMSLTLRNRRHDGQ